MMDWYVKRIHDWGDPNPVTVSTALFAVISVIITIVALFPPYTLLTLLWFVIMPLIWISGLAVAQLSPAKGRLDISEKARERHENLSYYHRNALLTYNGLSEDLKSQVPVLSIDDLEAMSENDVRKIDVSLKSLKDEYEQQQDLLRRPHVEQIVSTIDDLTVSYKQGNKSIKELV